MRRGVLICILATVSGLGAVAGVSPVAGRESRPEAHVLAVRWGHPAIQRALSQGAKWRAFVGRYGRWNASWNEATGTPHRAFGPGIPLSGFANDPGAVDAAVRAFVAANPAPFGGPAVELETVSVTRDGGRWYARYRQVIQGIPVAFSDWEFRIGTNGRLAMFGADARAVPPGLDARPGIPGSVARDAARAGLAFDPATDRVVGGRELTFVPVAGPGGTTDLRLAYTAIVATAKPRDRYLTLVDANTGAVLRRTSMMDHAVTGVVTAPVHITLPTDPLVTRPVGHVTVNAGGVQIASTLTDTAGHYSVTPPVNPCTLTSSFTGPYCTVIRNDGANANFSKNNVTNPSVQNVAWTTGNSKDAERDAYYHTLLAHDWVTAIDTAYHANDYSLTVNVNINDGSDCDAYWDGLSNSLNFFLSGSGCPNTATLPDIVWHEYCHSVNYNLYFTHGASNGLQNAALAEGLADAWAALMGNDPIVGNGFFGPGTYLRDVSVLRRWPEDHVPSSHDTGLILAGALWDLRNATSTAIASRLMHFAKYGLPDDPDDGVAMSEYFLDVLIADDDDANLSNGTPHDSAIIGAFNAHGIGTNFYINPVHTPIDDPGYGGPFPVNATVSYGSPVGSLDSGALYYSVNNGPWSSTPLLRDGDSFSADIPSVGAGYVRYYLTFTDSYGGTSTLPGGAPVTETFGFIAGPATTLLFADMETSPSWTVGFTGDAATTGQWVRVDPYPITGFGGLPAQPGDDHTPAGTLCWITGNDSLPGVADVDGGKTTLVTNTFNATPSGFILPLISYWRWYSDDGSPDFNGEDPFRVYLSNNNGSTWTLVENTLRSSDAWVRRIFNISDYLTPTATMKMRFVAQDTLNTSLVEAAVDDWALLGYSSTLRVPSPDGAPEFALAQAWPNPFRGRAHVRFSLPAAGYVELTVFDLAGRKIRSLVRGERAAGDQTVDWDGVDDAGRRVAIGPYYVRLSRGDRVVSHRIVLLR